MSCASELSLASPKGGCVAQRVSMYAQFLGGEDDEPYLQGSNGIVIKIGGLVCWVKCRPGRCQVLRRRASFERAEEDIPSLCFEYM